MQPRSYFEMKKAALVAIGFCLSFGIIWFSGYFGPVSDPANAWAFILALSCAGIANSAWLGARVSAGALVLVAAAQLLRLTLRWFQGPIDGVTPLHVLFVIVLFGLSMQLVLTTFRYFRDLNAAELHQPGTFVYRVTCNIMVLIVVLPVGLIPFES